MPYTLGADEARTDDAPPDEEETCSCCGESEDDCHCSTCNHCNQRTDSTCERCESCDDCCECAYCDGCSSRVGSTCGHCNYCDSCCDCRFCDGCECRIRERDFHCCECHCCADCCGCERDEEEECPCRGATMRRRGVIFHGAAKGERKRNPSSRFIAAEIEIAEARQGSAIDCACSRWSASIVEDGSLPSAGFEICTSPAGGDKWCDAIGAICAALAGQKAKVTDSCGLHVHIDARDFTYWDIRRLIKLYARLEPALFQMVPNKRRESSYCLPCGEGYLSWLRYNNVKDTRKNVARAIYGQADTRERKKNKYDSARYHALNLHSWLYRGTVECRLHTGTALAEKIIPWGILWAGIIDYANRATEKQIDALPQCKRATPSIDLLLSVAPTDEVRAYVRDRIAKHGSDN